MSLASRVTGNTVEPDHVPQPAPKVSGGAPVGFPQIGTTNPVSNPLINNSRCPSGALMNLLNSGLSVPRQMMVEARGALDNQHVHIHLSFTGTIGQGTFGQIEKATLTLPSGSVSGSTLERASDSKSINDSQTSLQVAVKRVLQDPRYKNRELSIMQRLNNHPNIVKFYYYYYSTASSSNRSHKSGSRTGSGSSDVDVFLHLILECFPESLCELIYRYSQRNLKVPGYMVKVFTYQMLKALDYLHSYQICHRDIKSSNLLVNESTAVLKVCDFGSAKEMVPGSANVSYISSRYYRAPELLFGAQLYTCAIDTWSGGCVLAEMLRQHCLFMGADSVDQLVKIIRVLGTPSPQDIASMNPMYGSYNFPDVQSCPVKLFFPQHTPADLLALMSKMLVYNPSHRILPSHALSEPCFDELREIGPNGYLPNRVKMPVGIFDRDPEPDPNPSSILDVNTPANLTGFWPSNSTHRHGSNKKITELGGMDKKGNRQIAGDWPRKPRPTGTTVLDKPSTSTGQHIQQQMVFEQDVRVSGKPGSLNGSSSNDLQKSYDPQRGSHVRSEDQLDPVNKNPSSKMSGLVLTNSNTDTCNIGQEDETRSTKPYNNPIVDCANLNEIRP